MNFKLAFAFWFAMVVIAVANGFFGSLVVSKHLGDYGSHLYKTFFIIAVIFVFSRFYLKLATPGDVWYQPALSTGLFWLASSVIFEFLIGHFVFGFPWERLIHDYRIHEGRLWSLVLASEVTAPLLNAYIMRNS